MARTDWKRPEIKPAEEGKRRIKLVLSYDGSLYHGWQSQDDLISVQSYLNQNLSKILKEEIVVQGSGRTDAGVHALMQVCHFDTLNESIDASKFKVILNTNMNESVRIIESSLSDPYFHSRYSTMAREYKYFLKDRENFLPFDNKKMTQFREFPSLELLNEYASVIKGTNDFTTFASSKDPSESKMRDIYESYWIMGKDNYNKTYYCYTVTGNAFLYHQVRSMVGTMIDLALKGGTKKDFEDILFSKDRSKALRTAPADGLYLARISYDENEYLWFEEGK